MTDSEKKLKLEKHYRKQAALSKRHADRVALIEKAELLKIRKRHQIIDLLNSVFQYNKC